MNDIIITENLTKYYGKVHAVDSISINVRKGEIYGFLGLNGAGKTTTIRMLLGIIRPTSGRSYLNGKKVHAGNHSLWDKVGYLVEIPYSYPDLTVYENLEIVRRLRLIVNSSPVESVMEKLKLSPYRDRKAKDLSHGNAQRLGIAKAIIHNPDILILDEPANGLDPAGIVEIREMLREMALQEGVTIFISSHILGEISRFATRIGIIHEGKLVQESDIDHLESSLYRRLQVKTDDTDGARSLLLKKGYTAAIEEDFMEVSGKDAISNPENIASLLVHEGYPPTMLKVEEEDLESYFLRVIEKNGGAK
ncbi:MAG: ABC transporter ATP-binding protein [Bacteroidales bacterium]|nr:MAG: ABC transporter ATP-binding protein [Bacteroidales bacterium]